ncbi:MAG: hypothetical protein LQ351_005003 [Letrouitia transgressa]|nr:MAG: hypothetical protein LQ351_005003 [Letrouitia transgressa]
MSSSEPEDTAQSSLWEPTPSHIPPTALDLLENYSHIPSAKILPHVIAVRDRAWLIFPYPCIGWFHFLDISISLHHSYPRILASLKAPHADKKLLDLGTCLGQDVRKLVHDGAPARNLYGTDLKPGFLDLGYELFNDKNTLNAHFFVADVLTEDGWSEVEGQMDFVHASSLLHLFDWETQIGICKRIVRLLRPQTGSTVFGRMTGNQKARSVQHQTVFGAAWRHNEVSFRRMWDIVGEDTGTKWKVWVELDGFVKRQNDHFDSEGVRRVSFEVIRE